MAQNTADVVIITRDYDPHSDIVVRALMNSGIAPLRLHACDYPTRIDGSMQLTATGVQPNVIVHGTEWDLTKVRAVWYRRPGCVAIPNSIDPHYLSAAERAGQDFLSALYALWGSATWINTIEATRYADNKVNQMRMAAKLGFRLPETLVTNDPSALRRWCKARSRIVVKALSLPKVTLPHHLGMGDVQRGFIYTSDFLVDDFADGELQLLEIAACIFQERIVMEKDIKAVYIDGQVFAAAYDRRHEENVDWRTAFSPTGWMPYALPADYVQLIAKLASHLGLVFCVVDLALSQDDLMYFLEINVQGQWYFLEAATGLPILEAFLALLGGPGTSANQLQA